MITYNILEKQDETNKQKKKSFNNFLSEMLNKELISKKCFDFLE